MPKTSKKAQKYIGKKTKHLMKKEGKTQKQALGQSYGMARQKGYDVPKPKKKKNMASKIVGEKLSKS